MIKNCLQCNRGFKTIPANIKRGWGKYCSIKCSAESQKVNNLGKNNPNWKGGVLPCVECGKSLGRGTYPKRGTIRCQSCAKNHRGGENNHNWKGGISKTKEYKAHHDKLKRDKRKRNAVGTYTLAEWESLKMKYRYMCLCCKRCEPEIILTRDHVIPLVKGGLNEISNIQPLCRSCNGRKYTNVVDYRVSSGTLMEKP